MSYYQVIPPSPFFSGYSPFFSGEGANFSPFAAFRGPRSAHWRLARWFRQGFSPLPSPPRGIAKWCRQATPNNPLARWPANLTKHVVLYNCGDPTRPVQDTQAGRPAIKSHPVRACGPASPQKSVIRLSARRFFGARAQGPRMAYKTCYLVQFFGVNLGGIGAALIGCAPFQPYFCPAALRPLSRLAALGTAAPKPGSKRSPAACPLAAQRAARGLAPAACGLGARASARAARGGARRRPPGLPQVGAGDAIPGA